MKNPLKLCPKPGYHVHEEECEQCTTARRNARTVIRNTLGTLESKSLDSGKDREAVFNALVKALDL